MVVKVPNVPGRVYTNSKIRITVTQEEITVESLVKPKPKMQQYVIPDDGMVQQQQGVPYQYQQQQQPVQYVQQVPQRRQVFQQIPQQQQQPPANDLPAKLHKAKRTVDGITDLLGFGDR